MDTPDDKSKGKMGFLTASREKYRFALALTILMIFALMLVSALWGGYADPVVLGGMFSGWIVAIVGFYFMDEASERSTGQQTARTVNNRLDASVDVCDENMQQKNKTIKELSDEITKLTQMAKDYAEIVAFQEKKLESQKQAGSGRQ